MIKYANNFITFYAYIINLSNIKIIIQKCFEQALFAAVFDWRDIKHPNRK